MAPRHPRQIPMGDRPAPEVGQAGLGQFAVEEGAACCWDGQNWSPLKKRCTGVPTCPEGMAASGDDCVDAPRAAVVPEPRDQKEPKESRDPKSRPREAALRSSACWPWLKPN